MAGVLIVGITLILIGDITEALITGTPGDLTPITTHGLVAASVGAVVIGAEATGVVAGAALPS